MSQHQWSYMKESWIDDETVGPIDETAFLQQLRDGTIKPHWTVGSPTRTKRQWVKAQDNAICNQAIVEGRAQVREEKEKAKSLKRAEREQQNRQAALLNMGMHTHCAQKGMTVQGGSKLIFFLIFQLSTFKISE